MKSPPGRRRLLWTADDLGYSGPVNEGIALAHRQGLVRNASLLAGGPAFAGAVRLARQMPGLSLGVHLAAVEMRAVAPAARLPGLAGPDGSLPRDFLRFFARYATGSIRPSIVAIEWEAQIARVRDAGLEPLYLDSHQHLHLAPGLFEVTVRLAKRFGIRAVRAPADAAPGRAGPMRAAMLRALFGLGRRARTAARRAGLFTPDGTVGVAEAGRLRASHLRAALPWMGPGVWELVSHPGMGEPAGSPAGEWGDRPAELEMARDPALAEDLRRAGVEVVGYRDCL
ncbi:MAG: ChbG/HpnK family deacetylase [Candidatus Eisenbacteria bacterium]|nr:ChbG/HpnK family deacetylase [Candidatus Eisenbacteria bacterium]